MSTAQPLDPATSTGTGAFPLGTAHRRAASSSAVPPGTVPLSPNAAGSGSATGAANSPGDASLEPNLLEHTKQQIRVLVQEITQLTKSGVEFTEFCEGFLSRIISALAAVGGAIWTVTEAGGVELRYQVNLPASLSGEKANHDPRHRLLLKKIVTGNQALLAPPRSGATDADSGSQDSKNQEAGNPSEFLLVLAPVSAESGVRMVVEVFQRPGGGPATQRGYLRFLVQMCELAADYLKNRRLRLYSDRQSLWQQTETFLRAVHQSLDVRQTSLTIVNEGRRLVGCDRVGLAVKHGSQWKIDAVSGVDVVERRSAVIQALETLVATVVATGEPLRFRGTCENLPPQIEETLQAFVDLSHVKAIDILPLSRVPKDEGESSRQIAADVPPTIGAIIFEQVRDATVDPPIEQRQQTVADHSGDALANALDHSGLFLLPVWKALGKTTWLIRGKTLPKTTVALGLLAAIIAALFLVPADFSVQGRGLLQPTERHEVFAHVDGLVMEVPVDHGDLVRTGTTLANLKNTDIEAAITDLIGKHTATLERANSIQRSLLDGQKLSREEQNRMYGEMLQLKETADSLQKQLDLMREKEKQLVVRSPIEGRVVTWQLRDKLLKRPVQKGQILMTVVKEQGEWELELRMPEGRMGHVNLASLHKREDLQVTFFLATHPDQKFTGRVREIQQTAALHPEDGNTVLLKVAIEKDKLPELRPGATVNAKVHCGTRSLGYVWLHDVIEFVQARILF